MEELEFYHIPLKAYSELHAGPETFAGLIKFETCQRLLFFKPKLTDSLPLQSPVKKESEGELRDEREAHHAGIEHYKGEAAIEFLLEILCGLKSRVIGETEIFGQFKHFVEDSTETKILQWNPELVRFLFETVKELRLQYISKWGVQSYGSMIRKFLKTESSVVLVGYGQLGQKLLPWLKGKNLTILVRNPGRLSKEEIEKDFGGAVTIGDLGQTLKLGNTSIVLAAPLSNNEVAEYFASSENSFQTWIDCRSLDGEVRTSLKEDPRMKLDERQLKKEFKGEFKGELKGELIELEQIFARIEQDQERARRETATLLDILSRKSRNFCLRSSHRPLGWDDLCA